MLNCAWASALTKYDCRPIKGLDGYAGLEIGTPFSLPDGTAINLYLMPFGNQVLISDNGDTLMHLSGMGLDVWQPMRLKGIRELAAKHKVTLADEGDFRMLSTEANASLSFAVAISGLLAVSHWAAEQLNINVANHDLAAEAEPYIIARNPTANFVRHPKIKGASKTLHVFDFQQGNELIDVIAPHPASTGGVMRKVGDISNGPFGEGLQTLIIVDDRWDALRAESEMGILASLVRTQPFSQLLHTLH